MSLKQPFQQAVKRFYKDKKLSDVQLEKMQRLFQQQDTGVSASRFRDKKSLWVWGLPAIFLCLR